MTGLSPFPTRTRAARFWRRKIRITHHSTIFRICKAHTFRNRNFTCISFSKKTNKDSERFKEYPGQHHDRNTSCYHITMMELKYLPCNTLRWHGGFCLQGSRLINQTWIGNSGNKYYSNLWIAVLMMMCATNKHALTSFLTCKSECHFCPLIVNIAFLYKGMKHFRICYINQKEKTLNTRLLSQQTIIQCTEFRLRSISSLPRA